MQELSEKHKADLLPGLYPFCRLPCPRHSACGLGRMPKAWTDDLLLVQAAYKIANKNPLGSAAGYGSSFPLNRTLTTDLLGFETLNYNVVYAQMTRGKTEQAAATALANLAGTLSKLAMDTCLYNSQNFAFIRLPDSLTTGSSIMPHKKIRMCRTAAGQDQSPQSPAQRVCPAAL